jgi:bacterioferritin (cytochrome b1)
MTKTAGSPQLVTMINNALENEHAAYVQYLSHAKIVKGINAKPIINRLKGIARDHRHHQKKLRHLLGDYLGAVPSMKIGKTYEADNIDKILKTNLKFEKDTIDHYMKTLAELNKEKNNLPYEFLKINFALERIVRRDESHVSQLSRLLGEAM